MNNDEQLLRLFYKIRTVKIHGDLECRFHHIHTFAQGDLKRNKVTYINSQYFAHILIVSILLTGWALLRHAGE
jgi:hypothetical protein